MLRFRKHFLTLTSKHHFLPLLFWTSIATYTLSFLWYTFSISNKVGKVSSTVWGRHRQHVSSYFSPSRFSSSSLDPQLDYHMMGAWDQTASTFLSPQNLDQGLEHINCSVKALILQFHITSNSGYRLEKTSQFSFIVHNFKASW